MGKSIPKAAERDVLVSPARPLVRSFTYLRPTIRYRCDQRQPRVKAFVGLSALWPHESALERCLRAAGGRQVQCVLPAGSASDQGAILHDVALAVECEDADESVSTAV